MVNYTSSESEIPLKKCSICQRSFPATLDYFSKHSTGKDGLRSQCRECHSASRSGRLVIIDPFKYPDGLKRCSLCQELKPATPKYFRRNKGNSYGLHARCKDCCMALEHGLLFLVHIKDCPDGFLKCSRCKEIKPATKQYFSCSARHITGFKSECKTCQAANAANYRESNRENLRRKGREYQIKKPEKGKLTQQRRRARKHNLPDTFTQQDYDYMLEYWGNKCAYCGKSPDFWTILAVDHWIPISSPDCPGTIPTNMLPACHARKGAPIGVTCCNQSKCAKEPEKWLKEAFGNQRARTISLKIHKYFSRINKAAK